MNKKSERAWALFHQDIESQGGKVLEPEYLGSNVPHLARHGYSQVLRLRTGLASMEAAETEQAILRFLRSNGILPVQGNEYFSESALTTILDLTDLLLGSWMVVSHG